jgi:hypothetical protein
LATYDPSYDPYGSNRRARRDLDLDFRAIAAGTIVGWGLFLFLSLVGLAAGLPGLDPRAARPPNAAGAAVWTAFAMLVSSVVGGFLVVRLAGERRSRSGRMEAVVSWGLSMMAGTLIALGTATPAARAQGALAAAAGALLALVGGIAGATVAVHRRSARGTTLPAYWRAAPEESAGESDRASYPDTSDEPTILPPTH